MTPFLPRNEHPGFALTFTDGNRKNMSDQSGATSTTNKGTQAFQDASKSPSCASA